MDVQICTVGMDGIVHASFEVVRRRLAENMGGRIQSYLVDHPARRESAATKEPESKSGPDFAATHSSHTGVRGGDLAEIAREEKSSRGTILRISRTAPFTLLECAGIIGPT
jgi:hypothetical protein